MFAANPPKPADPAGADNAEMAASIIAALKLKLEGADDAARSKLEEIADAAPQAGLAHWSLGLVRVGETWLPFDRVLHETNRWPELYKYQQERTKRTDTFQDQLFLADGCREHKLFEEERAHLVGTLEQDGTFDEFKSADDWWSWWREYIDTPLVKAKFKAKQQYDETWYVSRRRAVPAKKVHVSCYYYRDYQPLGSCFAAGTLVETEQGPKAIEEVRRGDRVLAQDTESGELAFKPVFATTVRQQATLVKLHSGVEDVTCSIGHPLWVVGQGWRMAKDLEPGMRLNTATGTTTIETIEPAGTGTVYNLVVADAHTYFAGKIRIYTHDVTPRQPTDMVPPGLRKEFQ